MPGTTEHPPRLLRSLLRAALPGDDRTAITDELDVLYRSRLTTYGRAAANRWYARQAIGFVGYAGVPRWLRTAANPSAIAGEMRMAMRALRKQPAYAIAFVLTLSVGTGVFATESAIANWVLLRPVPGVTNADQLATMRLGSNAGPDHIAFQLSHPDLITLRERMPGIAAIAAASPSDIDVRVGTGAPFRVPAELVTSNYFTVLGASFVAGRPFLPDDDRAGPAPTVVVSLSLAREIAGDAERAVGRTIRVNGKELQIIGVVGRGFHGAELPSRVRAWLPLAGLSVINPSASPQVADDRGTGVWQRMTLRLSPGNTPDAAALAANAVMESVRSEYKGKAHSYMASIHQLQVFDGIGLDPGVRTSVRRTITILGGAAVLLLLLAIANLANLSLAHATAQQPATVVRYALGATFLHVLHSAFAKAALLGLAGTIGGFAFVLLARRWFDGAQLSEYGGSLAGMEIDARVIAVTLAVALVAAAIASVLPLRAARRRALDAILRRSTAGQVAGSRAGFALVGVQVALSLTLLLTAGLLGRTVANLQAIDLGFPVDGMLTFSLDAPGHGLDRARRGAVVADLERRLAAVPGVKSASFIAPTPFGSGYITSALYPPRAPADARPMIGAGFYVSPGLLSTLGVTIIAGEQRWRADSGTVVLSRGALEKVLPGVTPQAAIGMFVSTRPESARPLRIAAVIEDVSLADITREPPPVVIQPLNAGSRVFSLTALLRIATAPMPVLSEARRVVAEGAPDLSLFDARTARAAVDLQFSDRRVLALAATLLGVLGVFLAAVGLYGVLASVVAARRREIGVRSALGAAPLRLAVHVMKLGLVPSIIGAIVGTGLTLAAGRVLASQLYGIGISDAATYARALAVVAAVALIACIVPAYRAARVSPAEVIRSE